MAVLPLCQQWCWGGQFRAGEGQACINVVLGLGTKELGRKCDNRNQNKTIIDGAEVFGL